MNQDLTLNFTFQFWLTFFEKSKDQQHKEFEQNLQKINHPFNTTHKFQKVYQHLKHPSSMERGCQYFLFKEDIEPRWSSPKNKGGGKLILNLQKSPESDQTWENLLMSFIGVDSSKKVNGIVLNVRTQEIIISIWLESQT